MKAATGKLWIGYPDCNKSLYDIMCTFLYDLYERNCVFIVRMYRLGTVNSNTVNLKFHLKSH